MGRGRLYQHLEDTGHIIQANTVYRFTASIQSYSSGKAVTLKLKNVTESWTDIASNSPGLNLPGQADYTVSFSTRNGQNSNSIGDELGIEIYPGWWNNLAITRVIVKNVSPYAAGDLNLDNQVNMLDIADLSNSWQSSYDLTTLQDVIYNWLYPNL